MFDALNPNAFKIFTGPNGALHSRILEVAATDLFDIPGMVERAIVVDMIRQQIEKEGSSSSSSVQANLTYYKLCEAGWFIEQRSGYQRIVDFDPAARMLLDFLVDMREGRLRSYGSEIINVLSLLESLLKDPQGRFTALPGAIKATRGFLSHLRGLSANLYKFEQDILERSGIDDIFKVFFEDYIETTLISDYRSLNSSASPFRFRLQILEICDAIPRDEELMDQLIEASDRTGAAARQAILNDFRFIKDTFENIDGYLSIIAETGKRIEKRIRNAVLFLDQTDDSSITLLEKAFESLKGVSPYSEFAHCSRLQARLPAGDMHLYQEQEVQKAYEPVTISRPVKSEAQIAFEAELARYRDRVSVTPVKIESYLAKYLQGNMLRGSDLEIENLDDFFIFERLRSMEFIEGGALASQWQVRILPQRIENEWISCSDFEIERLVS